MEIIEEFSIIYLQTHLW